MEEGLLKKSEKLLNELNESCDSAIDDFDEYNPEDLWDDLYKIIDKIENLQQGGNIPEMVWMDTTLPSDQDEDDKMDVISFKIDVQYVERGLTKIIDWIENYHEEDVEEKKTIDEKETDKSSVSDFVEVKKSKEKKEKSAYLTLGPIRIPITKEQAKYIIIGFILGITVTLLAVVLPILLKLL
jgi:hypothetical protein